MAKRKVIVEMRASAALWNAAQQPFGMALSAAPSVVGVTLDPSYAPVPVPSLVDSGSGVEPFEMSDQLALDQRPEQSTYLLRGEVEDADPSALAALAALVDPNVVGIFADEGIEPIGVCPGAPAVGTHLDVERLLAVPALRRRGMDGRNVLVAIVDTGVNMAHLRAKGKTPSLDVARSWSPISGGASPGSWPVSHGTMCAFDACIAAPRCTLLDIALLRSSAGPFPAFLSDAVRAFQHLLQVMTAPLRPGERQRSLVVNNSWGMFHPTWDYPVGHPGNYSDNPNHPFNRIVASLERAGADVLFAAGNCGRDCPDNRCQGYTERPIYGANSHPQALSVAGADVRGQRAGYSSIGPGRLERLKPDVTGFTHFKGSEVYPADGGTSAATPVVAGLVAAVRTVRPFSPSRPATFPSALRMLVRRTAVDRGNTGYDFEYGYGIVNGEALARLGPLPLSDAQLDAPESAADAADDAGQAVDAPAEVVGAGAADGNLFAAALADTAPPADPAKAVAPVNVAAAGGVAHFFARVSRDPGPGVNTVIVQGLPAGTRSISVWLTEWIPPNQPHAGSAQFDTISNQLFDSGRQCRVVYRLNWGGTLPAGVQVMYGV